MNFIKISLQQHRCDISSFVCRRNVTNTINSYRSIAYSDNIRCNSHTATGTGTGSTAGTTGSGEAVIPTSATTAASPITSSSSSSSHLKTAFKPREVVDELNNHIIGQNDAKKAVAIAMRNRWRRHHLSDEFRNEVIPKNILLIGPTGCGKTEIARRMAKLSQAPFIKVEATKFTEVGFHGKDVDQIIKDLVETSINMTRKRIKDESKQRVSAIVTEKMIVALCGDDVDDAGKASFMSLLAEGKLEHVHIDVEVPASRGTSDGNSSGLSSKTNPFASPSSFSESDSDKKIITEILKSMKGGGGTGSSRKTERRKLTIAEARPLIEELESDRLLDDHDIIKEAITSVEQNGIVFIDEIDKLVNSGDYKGADASSEGVQRDLLPLIEGCSISTKHGNVNTDFILFIASGAFHKSKPSDLLAELQGRLPIRVILKDLTEDDLFKVLTEPANNLIRQQVEMLKFEKVQLKFTVGASREIAKIAYETNKLVENIGARRLHTIIERIVEDISYEAPSLTTEQVYEIDEEYVRNKVKEMRKSSDSYKKFII